MCGIAGFIEFKMSSGDRVESLNSMLNSIVHRGPDDSGTWFDEAGGISLGHRRLSILDLSFAGHQPMLSESGRFVLVFNGEIYNHLLLRARLDHLNQSPTSGWCGHSDTETLLACIDAWGIESTLKNIIGMFAFALWDKNNEELVLARDRVGEKPLYYGLQDGGLLFGSELKALQAYPKFVGKIDWVAVESYLRFNYIPAPATIYFGVNKLLPGSFLKITKKEISSGVLPIPTKYWSLSEAAITGSRKPFLGEFSDAVNELESLLKNAVQMQSIADVPVGAFLSGGIDSSAVVSMMMSLTPSSVTTFSIGMPDKKLDESRHAASVARHLGTKHIEHLIKPEEALGLIPELANVWDEPFADSSQIPTYLVCKLAKSRVKVALSGDGGDEFFLGYQQYGLMKNIWATRFLGKKPFSKLISSALGLCGQVSQSQTIKRAEILLKAWQCSSPEELGMLWADRYKGGSVPLLNKGLKQNIECSKDLGCMSALTQWDATHYLSDDILVKVDRASMANSLETRAPLLDYRLIEFAYSLPLEYKLKNGVGKRVLREVLYKYVPRGAVDRPKMGFSIPLDLWLREELKCWAECLLIEGRRKISRINWAEIDQLWADHQSKRSNNTEKIWGILMLIDWFNFNKIAE